MDPNIMDVVANAGTVVNSPQLFLGLLGIGLMVAIAAVGSGLGVLAAGLAAVGGWKKCNKANKPLPMTLVAVTGMPISQTLYGFILLLQMVAIPKQVIADNAGLLLGYGIGTGIALALSAFAQGKIGAAACDALVDDSKGFANYLMVLGIAETVALFAMVFTMINLPS